MGSLASPPALLLASAVRLSRCAFRHHQSLCLSASFIRACGPQESSYSPWIAFLIKFVDVLDGIQPAEDQIGVYLAFMGTLVAMHLIVPVIAVWWHNRHCRLKDEAQGAASENE